MEARALLFTAVAVACTPFAALVLWNYALPLFLRIFSRTVGIVAGFYLRKKTEGRRAMINQLTGTSEKDSQLGKAAAGEPDASDSEWDGIIGFFHPFCNAGGGGERVLWAAIRATQRRWPKAKIVVYTGDHNVSKEKMLDRVQNSFSINIHPSTVHFLYLSTRHWVLPSTWPHVTLLGQSLGSLVVGWEAFSLLVPDAFVDTMGYAFTLGLSKVLFPDMPTGAYVHYPTISTDMLDSLDPTNPVGNQGVNAGKGVGVKGFLKRHYWRAFAAIYSWMGASADVVMTNSSWTQAHIKSLWGPRRQKRHREHSIAVVYPPCAVSSIEKAVEVSEASEQKRNKFLVYIAQFRPEKNHQLILQAFAKFAKSGTPAAEGATLVLLGSVRDDHDSRRVYELRLLVNELHIKDRVIFQLDAPWSEVLEWLRKAYVGVNGMWNEHFGIGVVEYMAAGLIPVVHNSGGPKLDIVTDIDEEPTGNTDPPVAYLMNVHLTRSLGFHATTASEFAEGFEKALSLPDPLAVRQRARTSAGRFSEEEFARKWLAQMEKLVTLALKT
ncbi:hypothetical protein DL771_006106 [Monosporascus sp. 5C6A]|nr:hypothetical protein DL771_006106 [Monosporascus sp. 5C6A]